MPDSLSGEDNREVDLLVAQANAPAVGDLHLKGKLVGVAVRTAASVGQPLNSALLITIEDLVAGLARYRELPAQLRHGLVG